MTPMLEEWLIDGYNLIRDVIPQSGPLQISREVFFGKLAGFASSAERKVLVVLDGTGTDDEFEVYRTKSFNIIYSQSVTADSVIEKILFEQKGLITFTVVTKDGALARMARGSGSRVISPADFMKLLKDSQNENSQHLFQEKVRSHGFNRPFENIKFPSG
jgi:predicted RNA-binding protein with PIN domain